MKRLTALALAVCLLGLFAIPQTADARGKGWKDFLIGAGLGTALGAAMGGATTMFVAPQKLQDSTFQIHYGVGAGIGFVIGATGGALVGWLPTPLEGEGDVEVEPADLLGAPLVDFQMPLFMVQAVEIDEDEYVKGYFVYPLHIQF